MLTFGLRAGGGQTEKRDAAGFILLDVLMALFVFGIGFAAFWGLGVTAAKKAVQTEHYHEAIRLAGNLLESQLARSRNIPQAEWPETDESLVSDGTEERYRWQLTASFDVNFRLVYVRVEVFWQDGNRERKYHVESCCRWNGN